MNDTDKAERMQAWKAFLIPASLFVACLFNAAGIYILYTGSAVGVVFVGLGFAIIVTAMFLFVTFHNKARASGNWKRVSQDNAAPAESVTQAAPERWGSELGGTNITPTDPLPAFKVGERTGVR